MTRFPNLEWLTECAFTQPNSTALVKRLRDYKLLFNRGAKSDHTGQNVHVRAPLSAWFGKLYLLPRIDSYLR